MIYLKCLYQKCWCFQNKLGKRLPVYFQKLEQSVKHVHIKQSKHQNNASDIVLLSSLEQFSYFTFFCASVANSEQVIIY